LKSIEKEVTTALLLSLMLLLFFGLLSCVKGVDYRKFVERVKNYQELFSISGKVLLDNQGLEGISIHLVGENDLSKTETTDSNGSYSFKNLTKSKYILTPEGIGYFYYPENIEIDISTQNIKNIDFNAIEKESWSHTYGGTEYDEGSSVIHTADGGFLVAGATGSFKTNKDLDIWIMKINPNGTIKWQKRLGGQGDDTASTILQTSDRGFIIAGNTKSFYEANIRDIWVIKFSENGEIQWQKAYGTKAKDKVWTSRSIVQTDDGGYIISGFTIVYGEYDALLFKLNDDGSLDWSKTYSEDSIDTQTGYSILKTNEGDFIFVGENSTYSILLGDSDFWVVKIDSNGEIIWQKVFRGSSLTDIPYSIIQLKDNNFIVSGSSQDGGSQDLDLWTIKFDNTGNIIWQKVFRGNQNNDFYDEATYLLATPDGGFLISGYTNSFSTVTGDIWVIKSDTNGSIEWQKIYISPDKEWIWSVDQNFDGGYIIAGNTNSFGAGNFDLWLLRTNKIGDIEHSDLEILNTVANINNTNCIVTDTMVTPQAITLDVYDTNVEIIDTSAIIKSQ
jgi:hypothetical protein